MPANSRWDLIRRLRVNERGDLTDLREVYENRQIFQEFQTIFALVKRFSQKSALCPAVKILKMEAGRKGKGTGHEGPDGE